MMQTMLRILRPGQPPVTKIYDLPEHPGLMALRVIIRPLLDFAEIEHVAVLHDGRRADMFVDDESSVKRLPLNEAATAIYRGNTFHHDPAIKPESLAAVFGPAVLFDRIVWS